MRYSASFVLALSGALAQLNIPTDSVGLSVLQVLATAIPPESIAEATANPAAFSSKLASSLENGQTPEWYQALPTDVKSYLPLLYPAAPTSAAPSSEPPAETSYPTSEEGPVTPVPSPSPSGSPSGGNSTAISTFTPPTLTTGGPGGEPTSDQSTAGAALPTGMVGAGIAGAIGILGMLAL